MSNYCPEWIFGVSCAITAKDFLSSENSLNSIARKFAAGLSEKYNEIKFEEISECAEEILQFLSEINANDEAVDYLNSYIYRRVCYKANGAERKISGVFSSDLDPTKIRDYSTKSTTKVFRATIFGIRNDTVEKMPAGWSTNDVVDLDWFKELIDKPTDILDNF
tara:strand:- start:458 stop:949 length:492 start_codon:yes stop_codon:yes gene_type:complete